MNYFIEFFFSLNYSNGLNCITNATIHCISGHNKLLIIIIIIIVKYNRIIFITISVYYQIKSPRNKRLEIKSKYATILVLSNQKFQLHKVTYRV